MIWSLRETLEKFNVSRHNDPELVKQKYIEELMTILKKDFLDRVSRDIETDLRLSIHLDLKSDESKMFKDSIKDLYKFINLQPIVIYDKYIDVRQHVKKYLEKTFYDLTTVALHDWKAYSEMRNLAYQKYNLSLVDPYLPSSTLEQVCFFL
jgi:WASH complex subunit 7